MTNHALRWIDMLSRSRVARALLPKPVAEVLREINADKGASPPEEVRRGGADKGAKVRAVAFALGPVRTGASVSAVNVLKGSIDGGQVRAVNLLLGDVVHGDVRAVNVLIGDVHGGTLRDVHIIVGDVYGGTFDNCHAIIGDVHGGSGKVSRLLGRVIDGALEVERHIEP